MLRRIVLGVVFTVLAASPAGLAWTLHNTPTAQALTNCTTSEDGITAGEQQMLTLINGARAAAGLAPLKLSPNLNRSAAWKSADSSASGSSFSHTDSLGRSPFQRAVDCGYATGAGENIAYGYGGNDPAGAQATFTAWMNSPGHKANILLAGYKVIGIGAHGTAWTTDFGYTDDSGSVAPPPPPAPTATPTSRSVAPLPSNGGQPAAPTQPAQSTAPGATSPTAAAPTPLPSQQPHPSGLTPRFHASVPEVTHQ